MKQPKKPTRNQKGILSKNGLEWKEWVVIENNNEYFTVMNKEGKKKSFKPNGKVYNPVG